MPPSLKKDIRHIHIIVHSDFTTTGYGFSVLFNADKLGIAGYIKYLNLTTIEIEAEGTIDALSGFLENCKTDSHVSNITSKTGKIKYFSDFNLINNSFTK
jgi:acylphosphatase